MENNRTKQCKNLKTLFTILHILCLFGPFLYFIPYAFVVGATTQKVVLSLTIVFSCVLASFAIILEAKSRGGIAKTIMWLLLIGIIMCLERVEIFIYIMAIVSIIDELVIVRLRAKYKDAYAANREIDRRGE